MKWPFITFHFLFKTLQAINRHGIFSKNSVPFILVCFFVLQTRLTMTTDWFVKFHLLILPFWALKDYFSAFVHLLISTLSSCQKFKRWRWSLFFSHKTESYMHDWSPANTSRRNAWPLHAFDYSKKWICKLSVTLTSTRTILITGIDIQDQDSLSLTIK